MSEPSTTDLSRDVPVLPPASLMRTVVGGFLMGLANLVPGVSGGTMVLAVGLYDRFIGAVADVTRLRLRRPTLAFLGVFGAGAVVAVLGLSGPAVWLVTEHRWVAYSLFVGMTLGGVPLLVTIVRPPSAGIVVSVAVGFALMAALAFGLRDAALPQTTLVFVVIGAVASSSMILPGISGSYILLVFGMYDVIVGSLRPAVLLEDWRESLGIVVPVGIGVVLGIGLLSNVLKVLLVRYERPAHGVLLGLLLGSVLGLWPFQESEHPELVSREGVAAVELLQQDKSPQEIEAETGLRLAPDQARRLRESYGQATRGELKRLGLTLRRYRPGALHVAGSLALIAVGFALTRAIAPRTHQSA